MVGSRLSNRINAASHPSDIDYFMILFKLYPGENRIRVDLIISGFVLDGKHIEVFDENPIKLDGNMSERLVVMAFLKGYHQLKLRSMVIYAKERLGGEDLSPLINGDRFVYVSPDVSPRIPKEAVIDGHSCRICHLSQNNLCKRCSSHGHRTIDVDLCESVESDCVVAAFRADRNPQNNYYMCTITHVDTSYKSVEHYYQGEFCLHCGKEDVT